jgi:hypothetical protein
MNKCPEIKQKPTSVRPPTWLSRADKMGFLAEIDRRSVGNCTLTADEIDTVADLVSARSRLAVLNRVWRRTLREARDGFRRDSEIMALASQIDRATSACRRLAKALAMPSGDHRKKDGGSTRGAVAARRIANGAGPSASGREAAPMTLNVVTASDVR